MVLTPRAWFLFLKHSLPGVSIECPVFLHSGWVRTPILGCPSILKSLKSLLNSQPLSSYFLPDLVNDHPGHRQLSSCLGPWREPLCRFLGSVSAVFSTPYPVSSHPLSSSELWSVSSMRPLLFYPVQLLLYAWAPPNPLKLRNHLPCKKAGMNVGFASCVTLLSR